MVRTGFWNVMEIDMPFCRTWKVLEKERFSKIAMEKFWIFVRENSTISKLI